jgi:hypothetical protein
MSKVKSEKLKIKKRGAERARKASQAGLPDIGSLSRLKLKPGEVLVITMPRQRLTDANRDRI